MLFIGLPLMLVAGGGLALAAVAPAADAAVNCTLQVPANPLTAKGLATPYQLQGCKEADTGMSAFVQGTIVDPATGQVSVYNPLVIDAGSKPAVAPAVPQLPAGAVVGLWFGFNGDNLTLRGTNNSLADGKCVNGTNGSIFGQFAYCNAPAFFDAANAAIGAGKLTVPPLGTARDGRSCMTTRDFGLVDMDQSDNVTTTYLFMANGTIAQNTAANRGALAANGAQVQVNGSDNGLLDFFVSPTLGCTPFTAPDLADPGATATSLALNELQAAAHQAAPAALVPTSDPMAQVNGKTSVTKTNLYRAGVDQPAVDAAVDTPKAYCQDLASVGVTRTQLDRNLTRNHTSPDAGAANSLFTFLAQRLAGSYDVLGCANLLKRKNPVTVIMNNNIAVDAKFAAVPPPPAPAPGPTTPPAPQPTVTTPPAPQPTVTTAPAPQPTVTTAPAPAPQPTMTTPPAPQPTMTVAPKPTKTQPPTPTKAPTPTQPAPPPTTPTMAPTKAPTTAPTQPAPPPTSPAAPIAGAPVAGAPGGLPMAPMPMNGTTRTAAGNQTNLPVTGFALGTALLISGGLVIAGLLMRSVPSSRRRPRRSRRFAVADLP